MIKALFIAWKNFKCKKNVMIKLISCFFIMICAISIFFSYTSATNSHLDEIINGSIAKSYVETETMLNLEKYPLITEVKDVTHFEFDDTLISSVVLKINGQEYEGVNDQSYDFVHPLSVGTSRSVYDVPFLIDAYNSNLSLFTDNDIIEYNSKFGGKSPELYGKANLSSEDIIISDYMLERFGITPDSSLIGSEITLYNSETDEIYCEKLKLSCILDSDIFRVSSVKQFGQIITSSENPKADSGERKYYNYAENYISAYELTDKLSVDNIPHTASLELFYFKEIYKQNLIVSRIVAIIMIVFLVALTVSIITVLYFYYRSQLAYRRMLIAVGLKEKELFLIILFEITICLIIAYITAFVAGTAIMFIMSRYLASNLDIDNMFSISRLWSISSVTMLIAFFAVIVFSMLSSRNIKKIV